MPVRLNTLMKDLSGTIFVGKCFVVWRIRRSTLYVKAERGLLRRIILNVFLEFLLIRMIRDFGEKSFVFDRRQRLGTGEVVEPGLEQMAFGHPLRVDAESFVESGNQPRRLRMGRF